MSAHIGEMMVNDYRGLQSGMISGFANGMVVLTETDGSMPVDYDTLCRDSFLAYQTFSTAIDAPHTPSLVVPLSTSGNQFIVRYLSLPDVSIRDIKLYINWLYSQIIWTCPAEGDVQQAAQEWEMLLAAYVFGFKVGSIHYTDAVADAIAAAALVDRTDDKPFKLPPTHLVRHALHQDDKGMKHHLLELLLRVLRRSIDIGTACLDYPEVMQLLLEKLNEEEDGVSMREMFRLSKSGIARGEECNFHCHLRAEDCYLSWSRVGGQAGALKEEHNPNLASEN